MGVAYTFFTTLYEFLSSSRGKNWASNLLKNEYRKEYENFVKMYNKEPTEKEAKYILSNLNPRFKF